MLKQGFVIRYFTFVLLFAIAHAAVPLHEIFHHHKELSHADSDETEVHNYEKPCCKPVNYFHKVAAILKQQHFVFSGIAYFYQHNFYTGNYSRSVFCISNKAPPAIMIWEAI